MATAAAAAEIQETMASTETTILMERIVSEFTMEEFKKSNGVGDSDHLQKPIEHLEGPDYHHVEGQRECESFFQSPSLTAEKTSSVYENVVEEAKLQKDGESEAVKKIESETEIWKDHNEDIKDPETLIKDKTEAIREKAIAEDPTIEEGHPSEVVLEEHASVEKGYEVIQTSDGEKEIAESKAEELSEALDVEVGVSGGEERGDLEDKKKEELEKVNDEQVENLEEDSLQPKETEYKSIDANVITEDGGEEQGHPSIQQAERLTVAVDDAKPEESKYDEENETVEDKELTCKDDLEAEESIGVVLAANESMEKGNDVIQIGDGGKEIADKERTADLDAEGDVSGGEQGGFLEDIQKEELSSSAELQTSNGYQVEETNTAYTEQAEVNSSVEIAEPCVSNASAEVSTPPLPLELVESSSSVVVAESETREAVEEEVESNSYLNEEKETPTIGDGADEAMLHASEACEVPESGVKANECIEEASYFQDEVKGNTQDENEEAKSGIQEKEGETTEMVSSEIEVPEIHIKSEDAEGKDTIVEPGKQPVTIGAAKDYICDDISNDEVNDEQGSAESSGEIKEQVIEEIGHVKEIHEESASIPEIEDPTTIIEKDVTVKSEETENLELSPAAGIKEVCLEKEELQKPIDFEVEEKQPEHGDESVESPVQECNTYENELILNEITTQEGQSASKQVQDVEIQDVSTVNENAEQQNQEETEEEINLSAVTEEETPMVNQEYSLQPNETEVKSRDANVITEDGGEGQGHPSIQQAERSTVAVDDAKPEESKYDEENETVEDKELTCKDDLEAEESVGVVLAANESMEKGNDVIQIGDGDKEIAEKERTADLDAEEYVSGGEQGGPLEDIQKEELSSSAELQTSNGYQVEETNTAYTEQAEVNSSVEIAEPCVSSDAVEVSTPPLPLDLVESSLSEVVSESETREAVEEEVESNSYLNEEKETPTIGDAADETMLHASKICEVPESGVKAKECLEEASYIQVEVKGNAQSENEEEKIGIQEKESETTEMVSSETEVPEIHIKSEDAEGKDKIVEPEPVTIVTAKDYTCDDISNDEVNNEQGSAETSGEIKEQVIEEIGHVKEIHEESASIPEIEDPTTIIESIIEKDVTVESEETENLELSPAAGIKEVCLEKEEIQKPIDFEVEEQQPEHGDEAVESPVQECKTYENELILNEITTQEGQSASEQVQDVESMEKGNELNQIGDGDKERTADLDAEEDVSGGEEGGPLEDIQKEELLSSAELQTSNGYQVEETNTAYTEQAEVNSSVEIAEPCVPSDAAEVSTPPLPLELVESPSSVVVAESETREEVEEEVESNSYLNEEKETPKIGDGADETMLHASEACEVPESGVKANECIEEASYFQDEVKGNTQDENEEAKSGIQETEGETTEMVSSEIEVPEIHIKSEDAEGKDTIVEPEKQPVTIGAAKDYICDGISNEEVNDDQGSAESSGEIKEQVIEEIGHVKEIHEEIENPTTIIESNIEKDVTVESEESENLELSPAAGIKEVCLEKEELQKPIDFEVEEKQPEHGDEAVESPVQECNTYENELILNEITTQEGNEVNQIGDVDKEIADKERTADLDAEGDVSGGEQGGFLEDIQKEELSSSAELQTSNGCQVEETNTAYTEQAEVNSSVEIAEPCVPSDAAEVSTPPLPLELVESSSSVVVAESETREEVEEEVESNSYLSETMLHASEVCEVPESDVKAQECLEEASYIQVEVKGNAQSENEEEKTGIQEKESETTEVGSLETEVSEIHIKLEDGEGKDKIVEPERQPVTIVTAKDSICDDISNEGVNDEQASSEISGEVKEQVTEEIGHVKEIHEESASIPETEDPTTIVEKKDVTVSSEETENLELSSAAGMKEVCLEKEELQKPIDFVEEKQPEYGDEAIESPVQECNTYENELILNEITAQEGQSASEQVQDVEIQDAGEVNELIQDGHSTEQKVDEYEKIDESQVEGGEDNEAAANGNVEIEETIIVQEKDASVLPKEATEEVEVDGQIHTDNQAATSGTQEKESEITEAVTSNEVVKGDQGDTETLIEERDADLPLVDSTEANDAEKETEVKFEIERSKMQMQDSSSTPQTENASEATEEVIMEENASYNKTSCEDLGEEAVEVLGKQPTTEESALSESTQESEAVLKETPVLDTQHEEHVSSGETTSGSDFPSLEFGDQIDIREPTLATEKVEDSATIVEDITEKAVTVESEETEKHELSSAVGMEEEPQQFEANEGTQDIQCEVRELKEGEDEEIELIQNVITTDEGQEKDDCVLFKEDVKEETSTTNQEIVEESEKECLVEPFEINGNTETENEAVATGNQGKESEIPEDLSSEDEHKIQEPEKQPKSTDDSICDHISNEGVNDEQASAETSEEVGEQVVEKQNMSEENELGDAEEIRQTSDEHVTERSCEIEIQVIKEDISTEDVYNSEQDGERDIYESDSKLEKPVYEANKGSDSKPIPGQNTEGADSNEQEATSENESSSVKRQETVENSNIEASSVADVKEETPIEKVHIVQGEVDESVNVKPKRDEESEEDEFTKRDVETEEIIILQERDATEEGTVKEVVEEEVDVIKEDTTESKGSDIDKFNLQSVEEQQEIVTETDRSIISTQEAQDEDIESDKTLEDGDAKPISEKAVQQLTSKEENFEEQEERYSGSWEDTSENESSTKKIEGKVMTEVEEISCSAEKVEVGNEVVKEVSPEIPSSEAQPDKESKETEVSSHVTLETIKEETETKESISEAEKQHEIVNEKIEPLQDGISHAEVDHRYEVVESESIRSESGRADETDVVSLEKSGFNEAEENAKASVPSSVELQEIMEEKEEQIIFSPREMKSEVTAEIEPKETISGSEGTEIKNSNFEEISATDVKEADDQCSAEMVTSVEREIESPEAHIDNDIETWIDSSVTFETWELISKPEDGKEEPNSDYEVSDIKNSSHEEVTTADAKQSGNAIEASEQGISSVEKGTVSSESSTAELHQGQDMISILHDKDAEEHVKEETAEEAHSNEQVTSLSEEMESPGLASSVTLETRASTSEVNHESVDSEAKNLNLEELTILDVTEADEKEITSEEKKGTVSAECKEAEDTSTCITEGVDEDEAKEAQIDSTVTIESTEITNEETEAEKEEPHSEPDNSGLQNLNLEEVAAVDVKLSSVEAEGPVSGEYKEAEEDSSECKTGDDETKETVIASSVISESAVSEINSLNLEEVTAVDGKQSEDTIDANEKGNSFEEVHETAEMIKEATQETEDEGERPCEKVAEADEAAEGEKGEKEAKEEGGLQDCASKDAVISGGGPQIVFEDGKITHEVKSEVQSREIFTGSEYVEGETKRAPENIDVHPKEVKDNHETTHEGEVLTTGVVVEKNIDTRYGGIDAEVKDSKSQIVDGKGFDETSLDAATDKADLSLSDLLHKARDQNLEVPTPFTEERDTLGSTPELHNEETDAHEAKTDEERDEAEVMVESCKDIDMKTPKKHSNILSGVSSKVKHSISKVKKAITGKSSNSKTKGSKMSEALPDS